MKKKIFSLLVLLVAAVSGAWAKTVTIVEITGNTSSEQVAIPVNFIWNFGENQMILTADEIGTAGDIMSVAYKRSSEGSGNLQTRNIDIYMKHVSVDSYTSNADWIAVSASDLVFSGEHDFITTGNDFQAIELQTPFAYNGTDNLLICINDKTGSPSTRVYWSVHETPVKRSIRAWGSNGNFDPTQAGTPAAGSSMVGNWVADIQLGIAVKAFDLTKEAEAEAHGDIQFNVGEGENVKEDVTKAEEGDLVTVVITPDEGWVVNEVSGLWYANEAAARGLRRIAASPESLDMLKDFDLQFVSEDPETHAQTYTFEMKRANAEISVSYKKLLNNADITIENIADQTYTGQAIEPTITVKDGSTVLVKGTDYDVVYFDNVNAAPSTDENAPAVVITAVEGSEKYAGGNSKTFTINPAPLSDEMIAEIADKTYTTNPIEPALTITFGEGENEQTLVKGTDFTVVYSNNTAVGVATATATGQGNFTGTASADFNIVSKALNKNMISPIDDADYTGEPYEPELDVNFNGKKLQEGVDYTVEYTDNVEAGKATATITGMGNYTGEASANFYVGRVDLNDDTRIKIAYIYWEDYDGQKHTPRVEVRDGMKPLVLDVDYKMTFKDNVEAGTARITFQGLGNYKGKVNKYFAIKSYVLDIDMVQDIADQTWTGEAVTPAISVINGNVTLTQDKDFTVKFKNNVNEGTATAIINGTGNFRSIDLVKTFKIVKKAEVTEPEAVDSPGEATAISGPAAAGSPAGTAYDLGGRKAKANRKGVVIIDGKLVLKK